MTHQHQHPHTSNRSVLAISFALVSVFMLVEFLSGYYFESLALIADAGHMANDSFALLVALIALYLSPKNQRRVAVLNGFSLIVVALFIIWEAIERWQSPQMIQSLPMLVVAILGLCVNTLVAWLLLKGDLHNLNLRAAYLHVLADLLGSIVAIVAALSIFFLGWMWVDTVASLILSLFILKSGYAVTKEAILNLE
ncbi:cation diffusion facilitator family transporter [Pasteurella multocida]|uniref:cation diffusion facilitator family transporter n=1 Tax=Pasteurella multocida TaxID=747 RepID=UPI000256A197|nr:cation diffusion facilitator family transporter [Pasteurella multocida]AFF25231.1 cadmium, cobalt and zinc/H(+)-K(+) antiporter [Pasteurella multocida subsp. multocida str. HN06]MCL7776420.1 cation diffusion facilitator family transporter [Pasteurella multocida]MCL8065166.1 cation diffusion facilitator family transporter [Pasteurella multocida]MCL8067189.1 cation diffusion facilitator family transporter [Pasteurella multocida]MCW4599174.1 cation diffusion facilitator family transporter [Pas